MGPGNWAWDAVVAGACEGNARIGQLYQYYDGPALVVRGAAGSGMFIHTIAENAYALLKRLVSWRSAHGSFVTSLV
jgi:hypothetical protein